MIQQQRVAHLSVFKLFLRIFVAVLLCLGVCTEGVAQCGCTDCRCADSLELVKLYQATDSTWINKTGWQWADRRTMPISAWFGVTLTNRRVTKISLDGNQLKGTLPNLNLSSLQELSLGNNQLSGTIPNFNLPNLQILYLSGGTLSNQFSDTLPNFNLPNLRSLNVYGNLLTDHE